tara:strand:+ start:268 stop:516 length:249 start_codon:yes stop_codon:yes gene_type:complete
MPCTYNYIITLKDTETGIQNKMILYSLIEIENNILLKDFNLTKNKIVFIIKNNETRFSNNKLLNITKIKRHINNSEICLIED